MSVIDTAAVHVDDGIMFLYSAAISGDQALGSLKSFIYCVSMFANTFLFLLGGRWKIRTWINALPTDVLLTRHALESLGSKLVEQRQWKGSYGPWIHVPASLPVKHCLVCGKSERQPIRFFVSSPISLRFFEHTLKKREWFMFLLLHWQLMLSLFCLGHYQYPHLLTCVGIYTHYMLRFQERHFYSLSQAVL